MGDYAKNLRNKRDWFYGLCSTTYTGNTGIITTTFKRNSNCTIACLWWQSWQNFHQTREKSISAISVASIIFIRLLLCEGFASCFSSWVDSSTIDCTLTAIPSIQPGLDGFASTFAWSSFQYSQHGNVLRLTYILYMENAFMWGSFWITTVTVGWLQSDCI